MQVIVIGGGVIGCSIAWHLSRAGASVTLLERGRIGDGASSAAAGMLAPFSESSRPGAFAELAVMGLNAFVGEAEELQSESGIDLQFRRDGILRIAESDSQAESLRAALPWHRRAGADARWLEADEVRRIEPTATSNLCGAVYSAGEGQVNPSLLTQALARAAAARGAQILEQCSVNGLRVNAGRLELSAPSDLPADHVVLAGGVWSSTWTRELGLGIPVEPVRGQMAALSQPNPPVLHTIYSADGYLVPKSDGTVYAGATEEEDVGFDASVTVAGMDWLLSAASRIVPALKRSRLLRTWAGLRPATPDGLPLIGPIPGLNNATLATGHFRNGILLSLITGSLVAQQIVSGSTPAQLASFTPERFHNAQQHGPIGV